MRPALVAQVASEALGAVMLSARHITVHAHPQDLPLIAEGAEETLAARGARLLADATVERGGVRLVSDVGTVDAGIGTRWAQAAESIGSEPWVAAAATSSSALSAPPSPPSDTPFAPVTSSDAKGRA